MPITLEQKLAKIQEMRPIDDIFFEALAENKEVCEEMAPNAISRFSVQTMIIT